jgi:hypothetical protein
MRMSIVITCLLALPMLTGCPAATALVTVSPLPTPTLVAGTPLGFETILRDQDSGYLGMEPLLFLIDDPEDAAPVIGYLGSADQQGIVAAQVQNLVYTPGIIIALFRETQASSGYEVNIERVVQQGNEIHVYAQFWEPGPRYGITPAGTSPFHIIKLVQPVKSTGLLQLVLHSYPMIHEP